MSAPTITTITTKRALDAEVINLYMEAMAELGTAYTADVASLLAAHIDVYLVGADDCPDEARDIVMISKIREAYELIEGLPCLCSPDFGDDLTGRCRRCHVIGEHTPRHDTAATATAQIIARTLVQQGLFADADAASAHRAASLITMALWKEQKLLGSFPADAALREDNQVLRSQVTTITQQYNETDEELCAACAAMTNGGQCPFHTGRVSGALYLAEAIGALCDDIELADKVHQLVAERDS